MVEEYKDAYQSVQHYNEKINVIASLIQHISEEERIIYAQKIQTIRTLIARLDNLDYDQRQIAIMNIHNQLDSMFNEAITSLENQRTR